MVDSDKPPEWASGFFSMLSEQREHTVELYEKLFKRMVALENSNIPFMAFCCCCGSWALLAGLLRWGGWSVCCWFVVGAAV
eukprot:6170303-Karenia_brevis.AAC.1